MKLSEFKLAGTGDPAPGGSVERAGELSSAAPLPGQMSINEAIEEAENEEKGVTSVTPSGIEVYYSWAPRRLYRVRHPKYLAAGEWQEVPSVTTVLDVLRTDGLAWWGMQIGVNGVFDLIDKNIIDFADLRELEPTDFYRGKEESEILGKPYGLLNQHKLTANDVRDKAADRGTNVHQALEDWCEDRTMPDPANWPESERGYIVGLLSFLGAVNDVAADVEAEVMVGSLQHQYAGRYDLHLRLSKDVDLVTRVYPKRKPKIETIPAGWHRWDLKTRVKPNVYETNYLQLEAYEAGAVECGYPASDHRGVIVVTADGRYQLSLNKDWTFDDFLAVRKCYQVMHERSIVQALRDELGAKDVA